MTLPIVQRFWTAADLATTPKAIDWLIDGVVPSRLFGMLFGEPYAGKSLLALAWSCAVASDKDWLGRSVKAGTVFYVAGEGQSGLGRRVRAWCDHNGVSPDAMKLYLSQEATNFLDPKSFGELHRKIESVYDFGEDIRLIVVDTMTRAAPDVDENRAEEVMRFIEACNKLQEEFDATVLVLHHTGHHDKTRAKGSISMKGAVDFEYGVQKTSTEGIVNLTCPKMKDGERPADRFLRIKPVVIADGIESAVLVECDEPPARASKAKRFKPGPNGLLFAAALGNEPKDEAAVRSAFIAAHPKGKGDPAKNYLRTRQRVFERGWFAEDGHKLIPNPSAMERDGASGQSL